jgi:flagellar basal-body rod modification protein FlgD
MFMTALTNSQIDAYNASGGTTAANTDPQVAQERFLKLFVTQLNNQDPLNPMDNAEMTSQMAQINTVSGIQQLNATLSSMSTQFASLQTMQGTSLVGREVLASGNGLSINDGVASGSFNLSKAADTVNVSILGTSGEVLGTVNLGAKSAGLQSFDWSLGSVDPSKVAGIQVNATAAGQTVTSTPLLRQRVDSVGMVDGSLRLRTESGSTLTYDQVLAFM